jgi:hypothetical protein
MVGAAELLLVMEVLLRRLPKKGVLWKALAVRGRIKNTANKISSLTLRVAIVGGAHVSHDMQCSSSARIFHVISLSFLGSHLRSGT